MRTRYSYVACRFSQGVFREYLTDPGDQDDVENEVESMDFAPQDEVEIFRLVSVNDRRHDDG